MARICVNGFVLRWARETANLSVEEVAARLKKTPEIIHLWENGEECPTYIQLEKLAYEVYKRPLAVFFFPGPPREPSSKESFRTLPEFEYNSLLPSMIRVMRRAQAMIINLRELCDNKNPAPRKVIEDINVSAFSRPVDIALRLRSYFDVSLEQQISWPDQESAFNNWRMILQDSGVFVFKDAFRQDDVSGFCLYDQEFPVIYVNNSLPKTRQTFTLFHELGHLLFRIGGIDKLRDDYIQNLTADDKRIEVFCNQFAAAFLVPDYDFDQQLKNTSDLNEITISRISQRYWVSREVILRKVLDRNLITTETYEEMVSGWIQEATKRKSTSGGNYYATKVAYLGEQYLNLVFKQYYQNRINIREVADYLDMKVSSVPTLETKLVFTS